MNLKFYAASILTFLVSIIGGFYVGGKIGINILFPLVASPDMEDALAAIPYLLAFSFLGIFIGFIVSLIIIHKLSKRWGSQLNFGGHPVLKITSLSFLSFLGLLFLLLVFYPSK